MKITDKYPELDALFHSPARAAAAFAEVIRDEVTDARAVALEIAGQIATGFDGDGGDTQRWQFPVNLYDHTNRRLGGVKLDDRRYPARGPEYTLLTRVLAHAAPTGLGVLLKEKVDNARLPPQDRFPTLEYWDTRWPLGVSLQGVDLARCHAMLGCAGWRVEASRARLRLTTSKVVSAVTATALEAFDKVATFLRGDAHEKLAHDTETTVIEASPTGLRIEYKKGERIDDADEYRRDQVWALGAVSHGGASDTACTDLLLLTSAGGWASRRFSSDAPVINGLANMRALKLSLAAALTGAA